MIALDVREEIIALARAGVEIAAIEREVIEPAETDEEERAALWLLAWCYANGEGRTPTSA